MTDFLDLPVPLLLLLPLSVAAGVDFFLTLLVVGLSSGFAWPGMQVVGPDSLHWAVLVSLTSLYLVEAATEHRPLPSLVWHFFQLFLRPLGGSLLALTLLDGFPPIILLVSAVMSGVVCAFTHVLSWGRKLLTFLSPRGRVSRTTEVLAEDTLVLVFLALATDRPDFAFILSGPILLLGLLLGGPAHHLVRFGVGLVRNRTLGLLDEDGWRQGSALPAWIRRSFPEPELSPLKGVPAGAVGIPQERGFREGWLLDIHGELRFAYKKRRRARSASLDGISSGGREDLGFALKVPCSTSGEGQWALFLQRGSKALKFHKY